jgi:hypothetical protein
MRPHTAPSRHAARSFLRKLLLAVLTCFSLLVAIQTAEAQCVANPTGETAVGLKNASSFYLTFYIDGVKKDGVPPGDRSVEFAVTPGEHVLYAEATANGETTSVTTTKVIPKGHVCTWTVTDPPPGASISAGSKRGSFFALPGAEGRSAYATQGR